MFKWRKWWLLFAVIWGVVAAITGGSIEVTGARWTDIEVVAAPLKKMGLACSWDDQRFVVEPSSLTAISTSSPWCSACNAIRPPAGVYFAALFKRLEITWARRTGSALRNAGPSGTETDSW